MSFSVGIPNAVEIVDDDINIDFDKETGAVNIVKEKINERRRMKSGKSKVAIKMENENGKIYQLGLRIGNKNTTTMKRLKDAFRNFKI
ncbi:hypothetical protein H8356DRAFT_1348183 [Neocallimastix lanati (nom. inval.)]|nr:hypothetical protein H8356DRAFT_1348183 [Neocallimastix sp. JGI-2020a]